VNWIALSISWLCLDSLHGLGFRRARWRKGDLDQLHNGGWGAAFGTSSPVSGGRRPVFTAYTFHSGSASPSAPGAVAVFAVPYTI